MQVRVGILWSLCTPAAVFWEYWAEVRGADTPALYCAVQKLSPPTYLRSPPTLAARQSKLMTWSYQVEHAEMKCGLSGPHRPSCLFSESFYCSAARRNPSVAAQIREAFPPVERGDGGAGRKRKAPGAGKKKGGPATEVRCGSNNPPHLSLQ